MTGRLSRGPSKTAGKKRLRPFANISEFAKSLSRVSGAFALTPLPLFMGHKGFFLQRTAAAVKGAGFACISLTARTAA
jgi:hypothetical protein